MKLGVKPLKNFQNKNSFEEATEWSHMSGESKTLYFRLTDSEQEGLRYLPEAPTIVTITFPALIASNVVTKTATLVTPDDTSLWSIQLGSTDVISSGNVQVSVSENGNIKRAVILQGIAVSTINQGGC